MKVYAIFDPDGTPQAFYNEDVYPPVLQPIVDEETGDLLGQEWVSRNAAIPSEAVEITETQWRDFIENNGRRRWDGAGSVLEYQPPPPPPRGPAPVSDRQFAQALAEQGIITWPEAHAWGSRGEIPAALSGAIDAIPDELTRNRAIMLLSSATTFDWNHPMTQSLLAAMGWTEEQGRQLWTFAASL